MKIKDIMSTEVEIVTPEAPLHEVARKMLHRDCGCVIVAKNDRLVGMITDRDIALRCVAESQDPTETTAGRIMTPNILYCMETDDAEDVMHNMGTNKVRRLPVLNADKRLVGIVSLGDLATRANPETCGKALGDICSNP
jgi:CBS domain-containing protein